MISLVFGTLQLRNMSYGAVVRNQLLTALSRLVCGGDWDA